MSRWKSNATWLVYEAGILRQKREKARATSCWECAMSRWEPNTTWLGKEAGNLRQKERKSVNHVVLEVCDVALGVQHDVAGQESK